MDERRADHNPHPDLGPSFWADMKAAAAHWHDLIDQAANVAELARVADPTKMPVTDDYAGALAELNHSLVDRALHQVYDATQRYQQAFNISGSLLDVIKGGAGKNEAALLGALITLAASRHELDQALAQLPAFEDEPEHSHPDHPNTD